MELELERESINCYELVLDTQLCQEETQEAIVPDACPDILRILDARARACLTGKQLRDEAASVSGLIRASVFYLPEGEDGVMKTEVTVPFTAQIQVPGLSAQGSCCVAWPRVKWAEVRLLNPRKILLRADLIIDLKVYQQSRTEFAGKALESEKNGLRQRIKTETIDVPAAVQEKNFTIADALEMHLNTDEPKRLLCVCACPVCAEKRMIGNKLIFKGTIEIETLVCSGDDLKTNRSSVPFSQIMELENGSGECACQIEVVISDLTLRNQDETGCAEIELELLAQAVIYEHRRIEVLHDLYSTIYQTVITSAEHCCFRIADQGTRQTQLKELVDTPTSVRKVCHWWADLGELHESREGDSCSLSADVFVTVIYLDDMDELQSIHKTMSADFVFESALAGQRQFWCSEPRDLAAVPSAGGIEVRMKLELSFMELSRCDIAGVETVNLEEELSKSEEPRPSVILRLAGPDETLWDIAKCYAAAEEDIAQANGLEGDELPGGRLLLIPKTR